MGAKVCPECNTPWPATIGFRRCPVCEVDTNPNHAENPITREDAESLIRKAAFDRYYVEREAKRIAAGVPMPTVEDIDEWLRVELGREVEKMRKA